MHAYKHLSGFDLRRLPQRRYRGCHCKELSSIHGFHENSFFCVRRIYLTSKLPANEAEEKPMKIAAVALAILLACMSALAERLGFPVGTTLAGAAASVAFDSKGHLFVLTRGQPSLYEFDNNGKFIRSFGEGLFTRSHGLKIDKDGNIWATDVGAHTVMKISPQGQILLTLGTK